MIYTIKEPKCKSFTFKIKIVHRTFIQKLSTLINGETIDENGCSASQIITPAVFVAIILAVVLCCDFSFRFFPQRSNMNTCCSQNQYYISNVFFFI